jgi:hypothetical protein
MAFPGLVAANNLSDTENKEAVWGNLGAGVDAAIPTTNLLARSEEFGTSPPWLPVQVTVASDAIDAPNGTLTSDKIEETLAVGGFFVYQQRESVNETMVLSVFCKQAERSTARIGFSNFMDEASGADFSLVDGSVLVDGGGSDYTNPSASTVALDDGWYRCIFKATKNNVNSTNNPFIQVRSASPSGVPGNGMYVWGAQLEQAEEAGPYVPTTTAPVSAFPTASIAIEGDDILELTGARIASVADFVRIKGLATPAQPRLTTAAANAGSGIALRDDALVKASPSSEGDFFITRGTLDGQSLRVNGLGIASISGSPFSGSTASCPLSISSFAAPTNLRLNNAMTSGTLAFPEKAIPIETNDFILYAKAGQG